MDTRHNLLDPAHLTLDELRRVVQALGFGEQSFNFLNAILFSMSQEAFLQAAIALTIGDDGLHRIMAQDILLIFHIVVKNIMFHFFVSSFRIIDSIIFECLTDHSIDNCLLLLSQSIEHISDSFFAFVLLGFFSHFRVLLLLFSTIGMFKFLFVFLLLTSPGVAKSNVLAGVNDSFFIRFLTMFDDGFNECTWICAGKDEAQFTNVTMHDIGPLLLKLICVNGQGIYIAMLNEKLCSSTAFCVVKLAIGIHAFITVLKHRMSKNFIGIAMLMVPNKWNLLTVIILESIFTDDSSIRALQVIARCPSAKIKIFHFDFIPPSLNFCLAPRLEYCYHLHD